MKSPKKVSLYTNPNCPYCGATKMLLDWNAIEYVEIDATKLSKNSSKDPVIFEDENMPKIYFDDELIGSYQQLVELIAKGKL